MRNLSKAVRAGAAVLAMTVLAAAHAAAQSTTVILVRHAEKEATPPSDPPLTAAGQARANDLWDAVRDAGIDAVITTQYLRTQATAQPTMTALNLSPEVVTASGAKHPQDVAAAVKKHVGQTVLVVGHSNTIPDIIAALGAKKPADICDGEYDNLYVVTIAPNGETGLVRSKFGQRAPADACAPAR